jgi:hypothetical protein
VEPLGGISSSGAERRKARQPMLRPSVFQRAICKCVQLKELKTWRDYLTHERGINPEKNHEGKRNAMSINDWEGGTKRSERHVKAHTI